MVLGNKKPVMLYFSKQQADLDKVDPDQLKKLREFKQSIRDKGIQEEYRHASDLREKLSRQLTIVMREMSVGPVIDKRTVEAARASTRVSESDVAQREQSAQVKSAAAGDLWLEEYSDRAFIVVGDSVEYKDKLAAAHGRWIATKTRGKAWVFSKKHLKEVAKILKIKPVLQPPA